ncbi:hypothetical protein B0H10DRAFT_698593 [Mycena sp. CBHHK59/15]|nr:hypothetical protein B0H10DRAFT_698593 [Mycena sp. CBHHK59/15]
MLLYLWCWGFPIIEVCCSQPRLEEKHLAQYLCKTRERRRRNFCSAVIASDMRQQFFPTSETGVVGRSQHLPSWFLDSLLLHNISISMSSVALDRVGTVANILGVAQAPILLASIGSIAAFLNDVYGASADKERLNAEVHEFQLVFQLLTRRISQGRTPTVRNVDFLAAVQQLPYQSFLSAFSDLHAMLNENAKLFNGHKLTWSFDKVVVNDIISRLERLKTLVSLALTDDHLWVILSSFLLFIRIYAI